MAMLTLGRNGMEFEKWAPSEIQLADTKDKILELIGQGYRLCVEPDCCFMDEGYRNLGQDRPRIMATKEAAKAALDTGMLRAMTEDEVRNFR